MAPPAVLAGEPLAVSAQETELGKSRGGVAWDLGREVSRRCVSSVRVPGLRPDQGASDNGIVQALGQVDARPRTPIDKA